MERYELANGQVFEIIRFSDACAVVQNGQLVYNGSYSECRRYIEKRK